nr:hypothetical transcript [Hymenolepis microstoma]
MSGDISADRRFILLWKLLRHPSASGNELDRPPGSGSLNGDSPVLSFNNSGWRRAAMGLPPFTTELAPNVPNFNRCLLILLDGLEAASPPTNALNSVVDELSKVHGLNCTNSRTEDDHVQFEIRQAITNWLFSALSSGQAGRILAPLFATLLHPSTARTSLISIRNRRRRLRMAKKRRNRRQLRQQTANSKHGDVDGQTKETDGALFSGDESEDADEGYEEFDADLELEDGDLNDYDYEDEWEEYDRNICALSGGSPSGEVHFFVSNRPSQTSPKEAGAKRKKRLGVFSKTPILRRKKKGAGGDGTGSAVGGDVFDEEYHPVDVMTRLQNSGNRNSDVNGMKAEERISLDRIRRDVIHGLLSELLKPASDGGETLTSRSLSLFDQLISLPVKVLPIHEHLLVYLHKYDFNQVIYAFTKIRAILKSDAGSSFLLALAASPTMARKSTSSLSKPKQEIPYFATCGFPQLFGTSLSDLLARHFRCLSSGGCDDFARQSTADELSGVSDLRMSSLLDVLLHVCIAFHVSLVLPDAQSPLDPIANSNVRLIASQVLQLITETMLKLSETLKPTGEGVSKLESSQGDAEMVALISSLRESNSLWIDTAIQRSGLSQAILHSLATVTEISQLGENMSQLEEVETPPLCMRLLRWNYSQESFSTLRILLHITNDLLQLTEPHFESQPRFSVLSTPVTNSRGTRNSPPTDAAKKRISDSLSQQSTQIYSGLLPWCVSAPSTLDIATLKALASRKFSSPLFALVASCYAAGPSPVCRTRPRHIATQSLLLNTVRVALSPTARIDLHPLWFGFLRSSLVHWGSATALLINTVITQMSVAIQLLAEPFCDALKPSGFTEQVSPSSYPPDYILHLFTCLEGILHTFLLPFGQSKSALLRGLVLGTTALARDEFLLLASSTRSSPTHSEKQKHPNYNNNRNSFSCSSTNVHGLSSGVFDTPRALRDSLQVAEALKDFHSLNKLSDFSPVVQALQRIQLAFLEDPPIPPTLAGSATLLFAARDLIATEVMPTSLNSVQNWARGRAEMCHVFPTLISSLASLWLALNQSCDPRSPQLSSPGEDSDTSFVETGIDALNGDTSLSNSESLPVRRRCGFDRLAALTTLGYPDVVRQTIHDLLKPIALTHPALVISALAYVWPPLLSPVTGQSGPVNMDIMWLLASSPNGLPLTIRQCALVSLISGAQWGFQEIGNKTGRYVSVASFSSDDDMEKPIPLLKNPLAVKTLKSLLRSPPASMSQAYVVDLPGNGDSVGPSSTDTVVPAQMLQSSLLHFLYAWIVATGGIGISYFHLSSIQDFLRDVVPLTSVSAAISTATPVSAITSPISVFILVKIFNEIIVTLANKDEKRDQKDLQDLCQRLMEATASIAGTALEQATWFRRGLQVRSSAAVPPSMTSSSLEVSTSSGISSAGAFRPSDLMLHPTVSETALSEVKLNGVNNSPGVLHDSLEVVSTASTAENREFKAEDLSVLALRMLEEHMAVFFDVVYKSEEKDRVPSALNNGILTNIVPFLRSHNIGNAFHYNAASQVMAALSSYQFTRRAWRRDVFELFIDAAFFQATPSALHAWCTIVDNLMTQEKSIFKEALARLTVSQGPALNIFSSKEAECEQRAAHLKKINFIVFASEREQYCRSVSEILERLTDNLRVMTDLNAPILTQMFLCTRVLVTRISSESLASLWLLVIPELMNVFRIFAERTNGSSRKHSALNYNDLQKLPQSQLNLLLSASKLLATILLLPESTVPQLLFQRWVFVNRGVGQHQDTMDESNEHDGTFHPLMSQIASGLASIYQSENQIYTTPLLSVRNACYFILATKTVTDFERLELFFRSLGEGRGFTVEAYNEILDEAEVKTLNQVCTGRYS